MHAEGDGSLGHDGYITFHNGIYKRKLFDLEEVNRRVAEAPRSLWSDGKPPAPLFLLARYEKGKRLRYSAYDMGKFAQASVSILGDLWPAGDHVWRVWCAHVRSVV